MNIETLLHGEIKNELAELSKMQVGTEEYKTTVDGLAKLVDRAIEMEKLGEECKRETENQEFERRIKHIQIAEEKKNQLRKDILTAAGILIPSGITIWGTLKALKFELEGTVTTIIGRGFFNKLLGKK